MSNLQGKHVVVTVGPTHEHWDPVRYLTNASSGTLGVAVATALMAAGARVTAVSGPIEKRFPAGIAVRRVTTAREMAAEVRRLWPRTDALVASAAVSDYRFKAARREKVKKSAATMSVSLVQNPDILAEAGARRREEGRRPALVGFALETSRVAAEATRKRREKKADVVIGNKPDSFGSGEMSAVWVERGARPNDLGRVSKAELAARIAAWLGDWFVARR